MTWDDLRLALSSAFLGPIIILTLMYVGVTVVVSNFAPIWGPTLGFGMCALFAWRRHYYGLGPLLLLASAGASALQHLAYGLDLRMLGDAAQAASGGFLFFLLIAALVVFVRWVAGWFWHRPAVG